MTRSRPIRARHLAAALFLAVLAFPSAVSAQVGPVPATVVRVIDGDTVDVQLLDGRRERIRVIGLDTPEVVDPRRPVECMGREATARAKELLPAGRSVSLEGDPTQDTRDRYGRALRHLQVEAEHLFVGTVNPMDAEPSSGSHSVLLLTECPPYLSSYGVLNR